MLAASASHLDLLFGENVCKAAMQQSKIPIQRLIHGADNSFLWVAQALCNTTDTCTSSPGRAGDIPLASRQRTACRCCTLRRCQVRAFLSLLGPPAVR